MTHLEEIARELRMLRRGLDKLRAEMKAQAVATTSRDGAVRRLIAARMMGIGPTKLDTLIRAGEIRTAVDVRLVPLSEVRRYTAPKLPRRAPRRHDRLPDVRDEARLLRDTLGREGAE